MGLSKIFADDRKKNIELRRAYWLSALPFLAAQYGCDFHQFTGGHYRITKGNKTIDFYPHGARYHMVHSNKRGDLQDSELESFMEKNFGEIAKEYTPKTKPKRANKGLTINSPMPIGKYKGTPIKDLPKSFLKYIYEMEYTSKEVMQVLRQNKSHFM